MKRKIISYCIIEFALGAALDLFATTAILSRNFLYVFLTVVTIIAFVQNIYIALSDKTLQKKK